MRPEAWPQRWGTQAGTDDAHGREMASTLPLLGATPAAKATRAGGTTGSPSRPHGASRPSRQWCRCSYGTANATVQHHRTTDADHTDIEAAAHALAYQWLTPMA